MRRRPQPHINQLEFQGEHGMLPRGVAIWVFYFADSPDDAWIPRKADKQIRAMTYMAAKDYARAEARRRRVTSIRVDAFPI